MKQFILITIFIFSSLFASAYFPAVGDYVKPKSWSGYPFTYAAWTDPTGNPNPYARFFDWINKRCQVISVWQSSGQWYAELWIAGSSTDYYVVWPVNYVTTLPATTTDLLIQTL